MLFTNIVLGTFVSGETSQQNTLHKARKKNHHKYCHHITRVQTNLQKLDHKLFIRSRDLSILCVYVNYGYILFIEVITFCRISKFSDNFQCHPNSIIGSCSGVNIFCCYTLSTQCVCQVQQHLVHLILVLVVGWLSTIVENWFVWSWNQVLDGKNNYQFLSVKVATQNRLNMWA